MPDNNIIDPLDTILPPPPSEEELLAVSGGPGPGSEAQQTYCGTFSLVGSCKCHHHIAQQLHCGAEWCPTCGQWFSKVHIQRSARQFVKVLSMESVGYMVLTIPVELRSHFILPRQLRALEKYVKRMLRRELGVMRGISRWHFRGDKKKVEPEVPFDDPACLWHPHLNLLLDLAFIPPETLARIKDLYRRWLEERTGWKVPVVSINYRYYQGYHHAVMKQKWHKVRYVLRPTFDQELCDFYWQEYGLDPKRIWRGWRNTIEFGKLGTIDYKKKENLHPDVNKWISRNLHWLYAVYCKRTVCGCPVCGDTIKWEMIVPSRRWAFDKQGTAVLTEREYEKVCTGELRQILLQ